MKLNVFSEISNLKNVIIHSPIGEHQYLTSINTQELKNNKKNPDFLLFDEMVNSKTLINEHHHLKLVLDKFTGSDTLTFQILLNDILQNSTTRKKILKEVIQSELSIYGEKKSNLNEVFLKNLNPNQISTILITGYFKTTQIFKYPLPNLIFTRDIGAVIGNTLLTTWSWHKSRQRESIITKFIVEYHSIFKGFDIFNFNQNFPNLSIEGGDINIFSQDILCIGISQRTSIESIKALLPIIFKNKFKYVYAIDLPKERNFMHLDCIFTKISKNECLVYPPLFISNDINYKIYRFTSNFTCSEIDSNKASLLDTFKSDGYNLNFIRCGGNKRSNQDNELLTMGANVFTLKPGVIVGYFKNKETIKELKKYNYTILSSQEFCEINILEKDKKYFIYINEKELSRGHGGIRCLTFPIERDDIDD